MKLRYSSKPIYCSVLLLLSLVPAIRAQRPSTTKTPTVIFVVSRADSSTESPQNNLDAVVQIENGKLKPPYGEYSEPAQTKFAQEYFAAGKKYRVTFGGGEVGTATIKSSGIGCNNIHASASVDHNGRIPAGLSALATNSEILGKKKTARRPPTTEERIAVMKLVNQIHRSRGTTPGMLRSLKTTNLTATDLDGDGRFEIIGSFVIETGARFRRDLLLVAKPTTAGFKSSLTNFQSYKLPPEGFDSAIDFVDQLDLDGDGIAEIFVTQHGFDAYGYAIYKWSKGGWRKVYSGVGDAC